MASNEPDRYEPGDYDPPLVPAYAPPYEPEAAERAEWAERAEEAAYEGSYESYERRYKQGYEPQGRAAAEAAAPYEPSAFSAFGAGRGRHRVVKQRGGTMARSGAVLGAGVIAAVGAGGMAHAQERPAASISMPDLAQLPGVGSFFAGSAAGAVDSADLAAPVDLAGPVDPADLARSVAEESAAAASEAAERAAMAGEALRARLLEQADHQQADYQQVDHQQADHQQTHKTQGSHTPQKSQGSHKSQGIHKSQKVQGTHKSQKVQGTHKSRETHKSQRPEKRTRPAWAKPAHAPAPAPAPAHARHSGLFTLPVGSYTLTAGFGQAGNMWSAHHTGEDFAAPTGTPVKAVGSGTITQAGWAGAYGYRIVLKLDDGTELWFCHLSSMVVTSGKVAAGQTIGRVGATGNVTGPHLHLEVRPGGGAPIDPLGWLRGRGLQP
ncbi:M23 family metallopeptidase [Streptomyces sp. NPDC008001]|uniref:M23 family metallopeptidase n=1 Tax=Streptomyces sp. NPDC008001 TaxID=3364804 RepID=UPI0036EAA991